MSDDLLAGSIAGMTGVIGATMLAGTAIAGTGMVMRQVERFGERTASGKKVLPKSACPCQRANKAYKKGAKKMNKMIY